MTSDCGLLAWVPEAQAFWYRKDNIGTIPNMPVTSMQIAPLYSWLYLQTGDATYRDWGDLIFEGAVQLAPLWGTKQFNQSYYWSFDYVKWRIEKNGGNWTDYRQSQIDNEGRNRNLLSSTFMGSVI
jgi:hypothetical protein